MRVAKKDSPDDYQHVKGCFRYFFIALTSLLFWSGLIPIKIDKKTGGVTDFKLISLSSVLTFVRLLTFYSPFLILPGLLFYCGPAKREYEEITGKNFTDEHPVQGVEIIYEIEHYLGKA